MPGLFMGASNRWASKHMGLPPLNCMGLSRNSAPHYDIFRTDHCDGSTDSWDVRWSHLWPEPCPEAATGNSQHWGSQQPQVIRHFPWLRPLVGQLSTVVEWLGNDGWLVLDDGLWPWVNGWVMVYRVDDGLWLYKCYICWCWMDQG